MPPCLSAFLLPLLITAAGGHDDGADPFVEAVARLRPSVLAVGTYALQDKPSVRYVGTGFVIGDGNTVVTNAHNVEAVRTRERLERLVLYAPEARPGQGRRARVVAEDAFHDVALLRFDGPPLPPLAMAAHSAPRQGLAVGVIGYPIGMILGVVPAVHKGVVAAVVPAVRPLPQGARLTPQLARALREPFNLYQLDLIAYPGNSGSPVFDARNGVVLGVINKTLATRTREHLLTNPSGIAYAVEGRWITALLAGQARGGAGSQRTDPPPAMPNTKESE